MPQKRCSHCIGCYLIWENPKNEELWMLVIHEALYFGSKLKDYYPTHTQQYLRIQDGDWQQTRVSAKLD